MNSAFANSKFHQKRLSKAATKIQALCRAFLAQARVFRQRKLEPRLQELKDCEVRKAEELSRVAQQLKEERENAPVEVKKEFEESEKVIAELKQDIEYYKKENEELNTQRKEVKKVNKELQHENKENNEADFKVRCEITKLNKEIKYNEPEAQRYEYALEHYRNVKKEAVVKIEAITQHKLLMKKTISKIIKMVEEKAGIKVTPPASPTRRGGRRKSFKPGQVVAATKQKPTRSKSAEEPVPTPSYDWASKSYDWSNSTPVLLEDESLLEAGNGDSFNGSLAKLMVDDEPADKNNNSINSQSKKRGNRKSPNSSHSGEGGAAFDWATKSYNWANQSLDLDDAVPEGKLDAPKQRRQQRHSIHVSSSNHSSSSRGLNKTSSSRKLGSKSGSSRNLGSKSGSSRHLGGKSSSHKSKKEPATIDIDGMRDLLKELKAIKKELKH